MKHLLIVFTALGLFYSCSDRNAITTGLLNEKKVAEDSIEIAKNLEGLYMRKAKSTRDSLVWKPLIDSSVHFFKVGQELNKRLTQINFSLDSISRMK